MTSRWTIDRLSPPITRHPLPRSTERASGAGLPESSVPPGVIAHAAGGRPDGRGHAGSVSMPIRLQAWRLYTSTVAVQPGLFVAHGAVPPLPRGHHAE